MWFKKVKKVQIALSEAKKMVESRKELDAFRTVSSGRDHRGGLQVLPDTPQPELQLQATKATGKL